MKTMRYEYSRKPRKCPLCGSDRIAVILYGLPALSEGLMEDLEADRIRFGGCCTTDDDPAWQCVECATMIHKRRTRDEPG